MEKQIMINPAKKRGTQKAWIKSMRRETDRNKKSEIKIEE